MSVTLNINGTRREFDGDPDTPLLWVIREDSASPARSTDAASRSAAPAPVHVDGQTLRSCSAPVSAVAGRQVTTIEGLSSRAAKAVQKAWVDLDVVQCGYCQSGQIMSATALLEKKPKPSDTGHRSRDGRQHLSLRDLPAHPRGDPRRVGAARGLTEAHPCIP